MLKHFSSVALLALLMGFPASRAADWTDFRGPTRDGVSAEKGLPTTWSLKGDGLLWKAPAGGRSTPIVMGDRVFLQNGAGKGETLQERVMCFNADTGKLDWEYKFNVYHSDVPPHRIGWASPVGDPSTGNVYALGVGGHMIALSRDGKLLWERTINEDFGLVTTHGGRTVSPIIESDLVIVSGVNTGWGLQARAGQRFFAFDKKTGSTVWVSSPGGRPFDTTYSAPVIANVNGTRLLIEGGGDGAVHAIKAATGEPVWRFDMSKRGINTGVVMNGNTVIVSHSEENLETSEMGLLAAIDATGKGPLGKANVKWSIPGFQGGYSSPLLDGDRVYQVDNGANLFSFDVNTGRHLWKQNLGTIQKASPVLGDGKIYVGTENGKFYILKPHADRCEVLSEVQLGTDQQPDAIYASAAISDGRVFFNTLDNLYCIGKKNKQPGKASAEPAVTLGPPAHVQIRPAELMLKPGEKVSFKARLYDAQGHFLKESEAAWTLEQLKGAVGNDGVFTAASEPLPQAGQVKATVGGISGVSRLRVIPPLPWSEDFEKFAGDAPPAQWVNTTGKFQIRNVEGNKVLVKLADNPFTKRARAFMGPATWSNYTVQTDVLATEKRRQMGDGGVLAQRYALVLFGNHQRLELQSWQPETTRTALKDFAWKSNTWYRMKLRVESAGAGKVRALGKAWAASDPEPEAWTIERVDPIPNLTGSPGIYADAPFEIYFDNLKVTAN